MDEFLVVGIEFRTSKQGKSYKMLHLSRNFSDQKYGVGSRTQVEYVAGDKCPPELKVGDSIQLAYGRAFDGKAYVNGVHIMKK